jgi:hypothetical protein
VFYLHQKIGGFDFGKCDLLYEAVKNFATL